MATQPSRLPNDNPRMTIEHRWLSLWRASLIVVALTGACTKPNPQSCRDGTCTDPALPFCDVDGALSGEEQTCIAVACTANEFVACRGDRAITCNTTGTDYELELCSGGCDEAANGCRRCEPNETVCENGMTQSCDASGAVVATEVCALGCFDSEPRCRLVDPSNGLAEYLDMARNAPDLSYPSSSLVFDVSTGVVRDQDLNQIVVPSFPVANSGLGLRVFVAKRAQLGDVHVRSSVSTGLASAAFALVASEEIVVTGRFTVSTGGVTAGCTAASGQFSNTGGVILNSGGGGGGHATAGGSGGELVGVFAGGAGGAANGSETLVPLRGGCPAADARYGGGGAIQLVSATRIEIDGVIDARGADGDVEVGFDTIISIGAGAGGGVLLEAPQTELGPAAKLILKGGGGGAPGVYPPRDDTANPQLGTPCVSQRCSSGGSGAAPGFEAMTAGAVTRPGGAGEGTTGAGGGGMGRVRINTKSGTYSKASNAVEAAVVTTGVLKTR